MRSSQHRQEPDTLPRDGAQIAAGNATVRTRAYQQEMLEESLKRNIVIALDTGSGKTHIAVLRIREEVNRQPKKASTIFFRH
jgi:ERCC4-related helicase